MAKLSREFYEHFGDKLVDELVSLLNFARFDAKMEERFAQYDAKLGELRLELKEEISALDKKMEIGFANLTLSVEKALREQTRWFVAAWGTLVVAWAALVALNIALWTRLP